MLSVPAAPLLSRHKESHAADLVIVGRGLAGACTEIEAARAEMKVVLVQHRPVLGDNVSSEVPTQEHGELLGHSLYFYSKDVGRPVEFVAPALALRDITRIPRYRRFNSRGYGRPLWCLEYGGRFDTVHDPERIKWELWCVVYGVWDHIKNSDQFPDAANLTLEWVGAIPGKRERRRFEGESVLWARPEREMSFCVRRWRLNDADNGRTAASRDDNHQTRNVTVVDLPIRTRASLWDVSEKQSRMHSKRLGQLCFFPN